MIFGSALTRGQGFGDSGHMEDTDMLLLAPAVPFFSSCTQIHQSTNSSS